MKPYLKRRGNVVGEGVVVKADEIRSAFGDEVIDEVAGVVSAIEGAEVLTVDGKDEENVVSGVPVPFED